MGILGFHLGLYTLVAIEPSFDIDLLLSVFLYFSFLYFVIHCLLTNTNPNANIVELGDQLGTPLTDEFRDWGF